MKKFIISFLALASSWSLFAIDGRIFFMSGQVDVVAGQKTLKAKPGMLLTSGDKVITKEGQVSFVLEDGTSVALKNDSVFIVGNKSKHEQPTGEGSYIFSRLSKQGSQSWSVKTPVYTAGVRGTGFTLAVKGKKARLALFEGKVIVKDFVKESGFSSNNNEFLQDFISDMSMNAGSVLEFDGDNVKESKLDEKNEPSMALRQGHEKENAKMMASIKGNWKASAKKLRK